MPQPSTIDVLTPFDPTGYTTISGAQLEQFGSGIAPYIDKGLCIMTTDVAGVPTVPDAVTNPKWQVYLWIRQSATTASAYIWAVNAATDATFKNWISLSAAGIGVGSITGTMIALNTITDANISDVNYSKISGAPTNLPPTGVAGGDLTGNYPNPSVGLLAITAAKIANATITPTQIAPGTGLGVLQTNAGASAVNWVVASSIMPAINGVVTTANQFKIPQVATAGAGDTGTWQMVSPGVLLQSAQVTFTSALTNPSSGAKIIDTAHGLGSIPFFVRGVAVNQDGSLGYSIGDEIDVATISSTPSSGGQPAFQVGANTTNVFMSETSNALANTFILHKTTGVITQITLSSTNWKLKIYARL